MSHTILREMKEFTIPNVCVNSIWKEKKKKSLLSVIYNKMDFLSCREKPNKMEKTYMIIML